MDSLILAHNHLKEVPADAFRSLTQLNSLELEGNQITQVDKDGFKGLEGEFFFILHLKYFQNKTKSFLENLQYLRLGDNKIKSVPSEALRILHRLRHLDLRNNEIHVIADDAFTGFGDSLTFLNLQKNE